MLGKVAGILLVGTAVVLCGCQSRIDVRGKTIDPKVLVQLKPGVSTQMDVMRLAGSPSSTLAFDEKVWVYAAKRTETTAFFEPKVLETSLITIKFSEGGMIEEIAHTDQEGHDLEPVKRATKTAMGEASWPKQIFSNFGRQRKKKD
jgi:outer membrane protein assembly factor BamE (lipoprotein component of BamABCDE complex)